MTVQNEIPAACYRKITTPNGPQRQVRIQTVLIGIVD